MKRWLTTFGTPPVTLAGFGLLAAALFGAEDVPGATEVVVAIPLAILAVNLGCALANTGAGCAGAASACSTSRCSRS